MYSLEAWTGEPTADILLPLKSQKRRKRRRLLLIASQRDLEIMFSQLGGNPQTHSSKINLLGHVVAAGSSSDFTMAEG